MGLLDVKNLSVTFATQDGDVHAVNDISFSIAPGETMAIVGESGSGKSQTVFAAMGLLAGNGRTSGEILFDGTDLLSLGEAEMNEIRADEVAMIFQDPMTSLNPYMRVSDQMVEVLMLHKNMSKSESFEECVKMLDSVKIPDARSVMRRYPHECSGGMRQRIMIAIALLCRPRLLIADEPTTALDVTVQAQIMELLKDIQKEFGTAVLLITHDLGVVAGSCENTLVLYGGRVLEYGPTVDIFASPTHPYTKGLLGALPRLDKEEDELKTIPGNPPNMMMDIQGCPFAPRCTYVQPECTQTMPALEGFSDGQRLRACHVPMEKL